MIARFGLIAVVLAALLTGCAGQSLKDQRAARAGDATTGTPVRIGFVWPFSDEADRLPDGVAMAVQEINAEKLICDPLPGEPETTPPAEATAGVEAMAEATPPVTVPGSNCRIQPGGVLGGRRLELVPRDDAA
ncbi:MAG: hypothetical protein MUE40_05935, partial [Anaerolineae bacterium]|nr:hypothetical protein [Anaerolineae bacterium]